MNEPTPDLFLEVLVHNIDFEPGLTGLCAGFENGDWRCGDFARHLIEWLPEFALTYSERKGLSDYNAISLLRKAAKIVYSTDKYAQRGEFGELLLHVSIRQVFESLPAISKIYYKSAPNETVKGFDAVHVVINNDQLELWLGEAKFYKDANAAIRDVTEELEVHMKRDYLRTEFSLITNKIDDSWPHRDKLKRLLHPNTSLDTVFDRICIPVLITYDSAVVASYPENKDVYVEKFEEEILHFYNNFKGKLSPQNLRIHLFFVPLKSKKILVEELHKRLEACQSI